MQALSALLGLVAAVSIPWTGMGAIPTAWQARDSGTSNRLNGVAYGNGMYVAVGESGTVVTSRDGTNWVPRSLGATHPELLCVTHGGGRFVAGGVEGVLRSSTDGTNWTNGLTPQGVERINGVTYGYGQFVAVGEVQHYGTNYILTSSNGLDWVARDVPTTNTLFAVTPAFNPAQSGWTNRVFAAVGDYGMIVTSGTRGGPDTDGSEWNPRIFQAALPLRAVVFHGQLFIAAGDSGAVRSSSEGQYWQTGHSAPFDVRGLASSADTLVVVGKVGARGRLTSSTNGATWREVNWDFPQPLNGVCFDGERFIAAGDNGLIVSSADGVSNLWTKSTSGSWEEAFWSLGRLPAHEQAVRFSNGGVKTLAIGSGTTANHPDSLLMQNLTVQGSNNLLLLDWAGKAVPLRIASQFTIGLGAALDGHSSAVEAGTFNLGGRAVFDDEALARFASVYVGADAPGELIISNATIVSEQMDVGLRELGTVKQYGGTNRIFRSDGRWGGMVLHYDGAYYLNGGALELGGVEVVGLNPSPKFTVSGGTMRARHIGLQCDFLMEGGTIEAGTIGFHYNGRFRQTGGDTVAGSISVPSGDAYGTYQLDGGTLNSSNVSIGWAIFGHGTFEQTSGVHTNGRMTVWGYDRANQHSYSGDYILRGGLLVSDIVRVEGGLFYQLGGTNYAEQVETIDSGGYILSNGVLRASYVMVMKIPDLYRSRRGFMEVYGGQAHIDHELRIESPANFRLMSGTLSVSNIFLSGHLMAWVPLTHSGTITLEGGVLSLGTNQTYEFGPLGLGESGSINLPQEGTAVVRFADSRNATWISGGGLIIRNWGGSTNGGGAHRVFIGTNAQGLSAGQLRQVWFRNPAGFSEGDHPARILASGEIVPVERAAIAVVTATGGLRLSWSGSYELFTATNVAGPYVRVNGATSPYTNSFGERQRFFQLRSAAP